MHENTIILNKGVCVFPRCSCWETTALFFGGGYTAPLYRPVPEHRKTPTIRSSSSPSWLRNTHTTGNCVHVRVVQTYTYVVCISAYVRTCTVPVPRVCFQREKDRERLLRGNLRSRSSATAPTPGCILVKVEDALQHNPHRRQRHRTIPLPYLRHGN